MNKVRLKIEVFKQKKMLFLFIYFPFLTKKQKKTPLIFQENTAYFKLK